MGAGCRGHPRQDHHQRDAGVDTGLRRTQPQLPDRRGAAEFRHFRAHLFSPRFLRGRGIAILRDRGGEYATAFFDKRSKFVHYHPCTAILNNLEFDHADIFADLGAIETQFHHLVRTVPGNGLIVSNGCEAALDRVLQCGCWTPVERFGIDDGWQIDAGNRVTLRGELQGTLNWELLGEHNRQNALAALAAARHAGVPIAQGLAALSEFKNVKRRMEVRGIVNSITVYDDFAHHPTAIATTVGGLRHKIGSERILAVLEPRSNTMKLGVMKDALPGGLKDADLVFCYAG